VIAYALLTDANPTRRSWPSYVGATILPSVAATAVIVGVATLAATTENAVLPPIMLDNVRLSPLWNYAAGSAVLLSILALAVLWFRQRSVLDLWLMVVMCAYVIEICLISFPVPARYSVGWYAGRIFGVLSGSFVLLVLVYEITMLYGQLLRAVLAQRREREARLMTGDAVAATIAHEIRQPLSGMITNADAGLRWLNRPNPDLDEAKHALQQIAADGHRAGAVIGSIRAIFTKDNRNRNFVDVNELVGETLELVRGELQMRRVLIQTEFQEPLPSIMGDRVQLQQVLLNLIANAIDSMADKYGTRVLCIRSEHASGGGVMVSVADTGAGISPQDIERIFNPLFTTKSGGMGMGLSICRSIIESHEGKLSVTQNNPRGAVFQLALPADRNVASSATMQRA
jgi:signal transduction histidine kinase